MERIFINIASYRDNECQHTIKDLFEKAKYPDRLFVGICWQFIPEEDSRFFSIQTRPDQVRCIAYHANDSLGACWARHEAQKLWKNEEYTLQIDSHCRFVQDWDDKLINMYRSCASDNPILSGYPAAYEPPNKILSHIVSYTNAKSFTDHHVLEFGSIGIDPKDSTSTPRPNPFCAGGFIFGKSKWTIEVPYDPFLYFQGEEISIAVRLWTAGYDIFSLNDVICYHNYSDTDATRRRHWSDNPKWVALNNKSLARAKHLLGIHKTNDPDVIYQMEKYGLGTKRTIEQYEQYSGVNFKTKVIVPFNP